MISHVKRRVKLPFASSLCALLSAASLHASPVDYLRDVKPILIESCAKCHGASQQKGGLRLDTTAFALKGGDNGPGFRPGNSGASLLIQVLKGTHPDIAQMPYKKPPLTEPQIATLARWIDQGPAVEADERPGSGRHWSLIAPVRPAAPVPKNALWPVRNPLDAFILARLEEKGMEPSPEADRVTLIRRVSLDLLGLPPSTTEVDEFLRDTAPGSYERLVDRLLASPQYGERWGRHWLDLARYADSNGYSIDAPRSIWKYRDWVIDALNRDMPFDQFIIDQLAGDMPPNATLEQKIATGFHRNTQINEEGGIDKEQFRIESIIDRVNTTGTVFLGLTIGCSQCHDHKFDPFTQKEYYSLFAFFNNADEPNLVLASPEERARVEQIDSEIEAYIAALPGQDAMVWERQLQWERGLTPEQRQAQSEAVRATFDVEFGKRTDAQKQTVLTAFIEQAPENKRHQAAIRKMRAAKPKLLTTLIMRERPEPRRSYLFVKGDFTRDGGAVEPGVPAVLHPLPSATTANRLDLARWIADPRNPLTARVTVNRIWQRYFGKGIVETENDFGTQGSPPTHPELLDWLATEFMAQGWSLKAMHRVIVTSATYRQSSRARPDLARIDPDNRLLARQNRLRLDAEVVRDAALSASGLLNPAIGGPSAFPPIPKGVMSLGQVSREWKPSAGGDRFRRGLYTFYYRATPPPALTVFDAPDAFSACTRRNRSNTPLQALTLLNDQQFYELAQGLAARLRRDSQVTDRDRLDLGFRLCVSRSPSLEERQTLEQLLAAELADHDAVTDSTSPTKPVASSATDDADRAEPDQTEPAAAPSAASLDSGQGDSSAAMAAWTTIARVLLNLDETITRE